MIRSSLTGVNSSDVTDAERSLTCTTKSSGTGEFAGGLPAVLPMTATSGFSFMRYEYNRTGNNSLKASKAGDLAVIITCTNAKFGLSSSKQIDFIFINPIAVDLQVNGAPTLGGDQTIKLAQNGELKISWQAKYSNSCESNYGKTVDGRNQLEKKPAPLSGTVDLTKELGGQSVGSSMSYSVRCTYVLDNGKKFFPGFNETWSNVALVEVLAAKPLLATAAQAANESSLQATGEGGNSTSAEDNKESKVTQQKAANKSDRASNSLRSEQARYDAKLRLGLIMVISLAVFSGLATYSVYQKRHARKKDKRQ